jgi:hypothetical protein
VTVLIIAFAVIAAVATAASARLDARIRAFLIVGILLAWITWAESTSPGDQLPDHFLLALGIQVCGLAVWVGLLAGAVIGGRSGPSGGRYTSGSNAELQGLAARREGGDRGDRRLDGA